MPNMYLESYMSRVLDIPKYRADKDKDKINLVYFINFFTTNLFRMTSNACHTHQVNLNVALCCCQGYIYIIYMLKKNSNFS